MQTGVSQSAGSYRILQGQGRTDLGLGAGSRRILQYPARPDWPPGSEAVGDSDAWAGGAFSRA
eukprot:6765423-Pyramimonas_sp.AAC.1